MDYIYNLYNLNLEYNKILSKIKQDYETEMMI
jgi:hypothetical protein